jgi:hypothetical protein
MVNYMSKKVCFDTDEMQRLMDALNGSLYDEKAKLSKSMDDDLEKEIRQEIFQLAILRDRIQRMDPGSLCGVADY